MAAFGIGGALGSLGMASFRMPRRYLTIMNLMWGVGCLPLVLVGLATDVWVIAAAVFVVGVCFSAPMVIWGTLLQRRVPPHLLGRVSSLDFFVSLVFMPVSMAVAGAVSAAIGLGLTFAVAGLVPTVIAIAAIVLAKMPKDELAHPLDRGEPTDGEPVDGEPTDGGPVDGGPADAEPRPLATAGHP
jgi:MFS family permease